MSPSTATESSPLLRKYTNSDDQVTILDDDINGNISVIATDSSAKDDDNEAALLKRRLNGSPLMVLLAG